MLEGIEIFRDHYVLLDRAQGLEQLRVTEFATGEDAPRHLPRARVLRLHGGQPRVRHHAAALQLPVAGDAELDLRLRHGDPRAHAAEAAAGARRIRSRAVPERAADGHGAGRHAGAGLDRLPPRPRPRRRQPGVPVRVRLVRLSAAGDLLVQPPEPPRPRLRGRPRPHPRRGRDGQALARRRADEEEDEHVHRLHRRRRAPDRGALHLLRPAGDRRRQRGRAAHGRGGEHAPRPVQGRRLQGAVRGRHQHDVGRVPAPHRRRVGGMGQPRGSPRTTRPSGATTPTRTSPRSRTPPCS